MGIENRRRLISEIEDLRGSRLITYIVTTKPGISTQIDTIDLREIYDHLLKIGNVEKIDLFIYSLGGTSTVAWALTNLIREFTEKFAVIVPSFAFSCATSIALGADEIVMGKMGTLGPVDPSVANPFNPVISGKITPISVEDIGGYEALLRDKAKLTNEDNFTNMFNRLCIKVNPLALGNAYRHYIKARDDANKLLELHMDPEGDKVLLEKIVDTLVEKLYFHGHHIPQSEAKKIGLKAQKASDYQTDGQNLEELIWKLYVEYENELDMLYKYEDDLKSGEGKRIIPTKMIESKDTSSSYVIEQKYLKISPKPGTFLTRVNDMHALAIPMQQGYHIIPIKLQGSPAIIGNDIYDKSESSYWRKFETDKELYEPC